MSNFKENLKAILAVHFEENSCCSGYYSTNKYDYFNSDVDSTFEVEGKTITVVQVDSYGGEDQGEKYWKIYKFSCNGTDVFVKFDGSYYSYDGSTFERWFFVEPRIVEVTQYFEI